MESYAHKTVCDNSYLEKFSLVVRNDSMITIGNGWFKDDYICK